MIDASFEEVIAHGPGGAIVFRPYVDLGVYGESGDKLAAHAELHAGLVSVNRESGLRYDFGEFGAACPLRRTGRDRLSNARSLSE